MVVKVSSYSDIGRRDYQEDVGVHFRRGCIYTMMICDGHGGSECSKFVAGYLSGCLKRYGSDMISTVDLKKLINETIDVWDGKCFSSLNTEGMPSSKDDRRRLFASVDIGKYVSDGLDSGTTLELAIIDVMNGVGKVVHIGDSRSVWKGDSAAYKRYRHTTDQKPCELKTLKPVIPFDVTPGVDGDVARVNGVLAMGRAIGDNSENLLGSVLRDFIIREFRFDVNHSFKMVLASDGVWDTMSNSEALTFSSARDIVRTSLTKPESGDNTTCILFDYTPDSKVDGKAVNGDSINSVGSSNPSGGRCSTRSNSSSSSSSCGKVNKGKKGNKSRKKGR